MVRQFVGRDEHFACHLDTVRFWLALIIEAQVLMRRAIFRRKAVDLA